MRRWLEEKDIEPIYTERQSKKGGSLMKKLIAIFGVCLLLVFAIATVASPGPLPKVIKIGGQGVTSGAHADYGRQIIMGATLAIDEINAAGGILGSKLEMKFMDSELKGAVAVKNARYMVQDWGAHLLFGVDSSGVCMAVGPVLPELDRVQIFVHAATEKLTEQLVYEKGIKNIFRISVPVYQDSIVSAMIFKDFPEIKRWAGINCDYEYGRTCWTLFKSTLKKYRPDVEFVAEAWAPFWTTDFSPHISAVMAKKPDGIFATPWAGEAVMLLRQALLLGVFDQTQAWWQAMGGSVDVLEGLAREVGKNQFKGKLWATARYIHNWPDTPENKAFVEKFLKRWARYPRPGTPTIRRRLPTRPSMYSRKPSRRPKAWKRQS
jgi:branched-chain amino acid transport system substrate-binding protein